MADITYTPQFQPPAWRDNVDFVSAEAPGGFNAQFQALQAELMQLSGIVKELNDAIQSANQSLLTTGSVIQTLQAPAQVVQADCWGDIKSDGTIAAGSGNFTVKKAGTGVYDIVFTTAFTAIPVALATQVWQAPASSDTISTSQGNIKDNAVLIGVTPSLCRFKTGDSGGSASDRNFSFLAYGPTT